jgi:hypothetical protein
MMVIISLQPTVLRSCLPGGLDKCQIECTSTRGCGVKLAGCGQPKGHILENFFSVHNSYVFLGSHICHQNFFKIAAGGEGWGGGCQK